MRNQVIIIIFSILIAFGLVCGLAYAVNQDLNSDTVVPGLVAMELFKHGNVQFTYPLDDPYLFTDIYPFYLVTQLLSGFSPVVLRLTAFFIFILAAAVFSYIVYRYSGLENALIFAALFVNISPAAYVYFITPEYHVGTLLAAGVMIFLFDFKRIKSISFNRALAYILLVALIVISDYLILAMFVIPYVALYLLVYRGQFKKSKVRKKGDKSALKGPEGWSSKEIGRADMIVLVMALASGIIWLLKAFEPDFLWQYIYFNPRQMGTAGAGQTLLANIPLFFQCVALLVNQGLFNILSFNFSLIGIPIALIFLAVLSYAVIHRDHRANYLYWMLGLSSIVTFLGLIFLGWASGLWSARFLGLIAAGIFIVIALGYNDTIKDHRLSLVFIAAVVALVLSTVPYNLQKVASFDYQPNKADYAFIDYLKSNNITYAYSDYGISNKLMYLSGESVNARMISTDNGFNLYKYTWLSSTRWYANGTDAIPIFIADKDSTFYGDLKTDLRNTAPNKTYYYGNYEIDIMPPYPK